jgi:hypothetical protein
MMPTPTISHETWQRTRALAQIALGTRTVDAEGLSFERCIELLADADLDEREEIPDRELIIAGWPNGVKIPYKVNGRDRPHRPHISSETTQQLNEFLEQENKMLPVEDLQFEDRLKVALDDIESVFQVANCFIVEEDSE